MLQIHLQRETDKHIYIICEGIINREREREREKRKEKKNVVDASS